MSLYVNDLCIGLHSKCNWKCKYCVARWDNADINEDKITNDITPLIDKLGKLWLSGGEPGLLSTQFWNHLFKTAKDPISICTNGTFIERGYADLYKSKIRRIMLHCVEEIDQDININIVKFIKKTKISLSVNFVVHRENPQLIDSFLGKYNGIQFQINFTDQTFAEINRKYNKNYKYHMDQSAVITAIKQLSKFKNYSRYIDFLTKKLIQKNFKYLNRWSNKNHN